MKDDVQKLLKLIAELASSGMPIVVEGPRDRDALIALGISQEIIVLNTGRRIIQTCEYIASKHYKKVVILTDYDKTGGKLAGILKSNLRSMGIKYDLEYRKRIFMLAVGVRCVEKLPGFINTHL